MIAVMRELGLGCGASKRVVSLTEGRLAEGDTSGDLLHGPRNVWRFDEAPVDTGRSKMERGWHG
jgi:hypothetical protein